EAQRISRQEREASYQEVAPGEDQGVNQGFASHPGWASAHAPIMVAVKRVAVPRSRRILGNNSVAQARAKGVHDRLVIRRKKDEGAAVLGQPFLSLGNEIFDGLYAALFRPGHCIRSPHMDAEHMGGRESFLPEVFHALQDLVSRARELLDPTVHVAARRLAGGAGIIVSAREVGDAETLEDMTRRVVEPGVRKEILVRVSADFRIEVQR